MGQRYADITPDLSRAIAHAPLFFVATAPLAASGHVNLSPKGLDTLRVLDAHRIAYLDFTGSGNETSAHVTENGRLTVMVCAFSGKPQIIRVYCRGRVVTRLSPEWAVLAPRFPEIPGARQIVVGEVEWVMTSCGYAVPLLDVVGERDTLTRWSEGKGEEGLVAYRRTHNAHSLDGVPAPATDPA